MRTFYGLWELAAEVFSNLTWEGMEAVIYAGDADDVYHITYRRAGSFGAPEHERSIICAVDLSPVAWEYSVAEWGIDPELIGTTDLDEDLARDYISGPLVDHLRYRMDARREDLQQAAREYKELEQ